MCRFFLGLRQIYYDPVDGERGSSPTVISTVRFANNLNVIGPLAGSFVTNEDEDSDDGVLDVREQEETRTVHSDSEGVEMSSLMKGSA